MASHVALGFFLIGREKGTSFVVVVVSRVSLLPGHKVKDPGNKVSFPLFSSILPKKKRKILQFTTNQRESFFFFA